MELATQQIGDTPLIILAGGKSSRWRNPEGVSKALAKINNTTFLEHIIAGYQSIGGRNIIVVLGYHQILISNYLQNKTFDLQVETITNSNPSKGSFSSVQVGVQYFFKNYQAPYVFVSPVDCLGYDPQIFVQMLIAINNNTRAIIPQFQQKGGHPILLSRELCATLSATRLDSDQARLDRQLKKLPPQQIVYLPTEDSSILTNINCLKDLQSAKIERQANTL